MPLLRIRINGSDDDLRAIADLLQSVEGIEHVEEISDLMPHMDDEDSSSAGLPDDESPGLHTIEVDAPSAEAMRRLHVAVGATAERTESAIEIIEDFRE